MSAAPEPAFSCQVPNSPTVHLTLGTVDGKRGQTLCGLDELLLATKNPTPSCPGCVAQSPGSPSGLPYVHANVVES
jgi:hypothetical protein